MYVSKRILLACMTMMLVLLACAAPAQCDTFSVLHNFSDSSEKTPEGSLILSGNYLYGMTSGGVNYNAGTIFRININNPSDYSILHSFGSVANDGQKPYGNLTLSGNYLYGMTHDGGENSVGTVFKMNINNPSDYTILHDFGDPGISISPDAGDGAQPYGSLTLYGGNLYGMTSVGGNGNGTIFEIDTADGSGYSVLHVFAGGAADGSSPYYSNLTVDADGTLYGMTYGGGQNYGTIFQYETGTGVCSLLHSFSGLADGGYPYGSLTLVDGKLYGMTSAGGDYIYSGAIFEFDPTTPEVDPVTLYSFSDSTGSNPRGSLTYAGNGIFYGMTQFYGPDSDSYGTIFKLDTTKDESDPGYYQTLRSFDDASDAPVIPYGDLTIVNDVLYGMTPRGGVGDAGAVFAYASSGSIPPVGDVPEPSTLLLLLPFLGFGFARMKRICKTE